MCSTNERTSKRYRPTKRTKPASLPPLVLILVSTSEIITEIQTLEPEAKQPVQRTPPIHPPHLQPWKQASKRVTCRTIHQTRGLHSTNSKPIKETYLWTGLLKWTHEAHTVTRGFSRVTSRDMQMYSWRHVVRVVMWCSRQRFQLRKARRLRRSHQMKRLDWHRGLCIYYEQPAVVFFFVHLILVMRKL